METLGNKNADKSTEKTTDKYICELCDYKTCHKGHYNEHLFSRKHSERKRLETVGNKNADISDSSDNHNYYTCDKCERIYKNRAGLWKHNKRCVLATNVNDYELPSEDKIDISGSSNTIINKDELIIRLLKQNAELLEIVKAGTHGTNTNNSHNNTNHTNSHNKAFNLNFFLNETCKNAMNITDFVDSIKLQLSDFMEVGELGYVQGISNIIVKSLNSLDETIRPIHCTDQKRETFYVKDENKWEKEEEDMKRIKKMIQRISYKNEKLMNTYKERYPDYKDPESFRSDQYSKTIIEVLGGVGENEKEKENKIIRNISRATRIKKDFSN